MVIIRLFTVRTANLFSLSIILTSAAQEKPQVAEVVAVGPGKTVDGKLVPVQLKVGDKVLMSKYSGTEVKVDGEEYTILREEDILAVVE